MDVGVLWAGYQDKAVRHTVLRAGGQAWGLCECPAHIGAYLMVEISCSWLLVQVPIVEPEILLDGEHDIDRTLEVSQQILLMCQVL